MSLYRTPEPIARILRKEANFGCLICGCPFLKYHHFDPTWAEEHHNDPNGMVALCALHADQADNGAWTKEQMRKIKDNPRLQNSSVIFNDIPWLRQQIIYFLGGDIFVNPRNILNIDNKRIIWVDKDEDGNNLLGIDYSTSDNEGLFLMEKNSWVSIASVKDLDCSPGGNKICINNADEIDYLYIRFKNYRKDRLREKIKMIYRKFYHSSQARKMRIRFAKIENDFSRTTDSLVFYESKIDEVVSELEACEVENQYAVCEIFGNFNSRNIVVRPTEITIDNKRKVLALNTHFEQGLDLSSNGRIVM